MPTKPRVRYAPSPTGDFHVGGARTALFNYLFARHHGGTFILRIEDTDQKRYIPEALDWLRNGLRYIGLDYDEGPDAGGEHGPYVQTQRLDLYSRHCAQLLEAGAAYPCFCTPERLEEANTEAQKRGERGGYPRFCRDIPPDEARRRIESGETHTVRFRAPVDGEVVVHDEIRGEVRFQNAILQDAVLMKSDGIPTYHLANVIDDHLMEITHILRGEEWISSAPLHVHLYRAFDWEPPVMAHLPLILNPTGKGKMSKREERAPDGQLLPVFVRRFEELGYLPEAMVNFMALVGWSFDDKTEMMSREELIERFTLDRVNPSPAVWNYDKLDHMNGQYIRQLAVPDLAGRLAPWVPDAEPGRLEAIAPLVQERMTRLADIVSVADFFFAEELPPYDSAELIPKKGDAAMARSALERAREVLATAEWNVEAMEEALRTAAEAAGLKPGQMFQPIRVAVSGRKVSPPLFETLVVLGRDTCLKRIDQAIGKL